MVNYKGQSLAIVLVLLIVGSIVGFALYARFVRESGRIVEEQASSEANELTETVVGLISTSNYEKLQDVEVLNFLDCDAESLLTEGCRKSGITLTGLGEFFDYMDLSVDFSDFGFDFDPDFCLSELAMSYSLEEDEVTIDQDNVYSVFVNRVDWDSCTSIDFVMTDNGNAEGFVLSTFYGSYDSSGNLLSHKDYSFSDITGFSYFEPGAGENWIPYSSSLEQLSFNKSDSSSGGFDLNEIRFKSLGGSSNLRWSLSGGSCDVDGYLLMEVGATCEGNYVGKSFVVPGEIFAPPIFDYVLFNGYGDLIPEGIQRD